jgi:HAE1 family hydrophobic/amphiphilic exporter-1
MKQPGFHGALVARPVLLLVMYATVLVVGVACYLAIPLQLMPDGITSPGLQVFLSNPGASAQENEEEVARVLEEQFRTLPGIESIQSNSSPDTVGIFLQFRADLDMDWAKSEVRDRLERARSSLPAGVEEASIWSWSQSDLPAMFFAVLHPGDSERTDFLLDAVVKRRLEAVDGVGRVEVWGSLEDSLRILLDEDKVRAANLDLGQLVARLSADNYASPLGEIEDGGRRTMLRVDMRWRSPQEIEELPIGDGLRIKDVGRVAAVKSVRQNLFRIDGRYAYYGEVQKDGTANTVETCKRLRAEFAALSEDPQLAGQLEFMPLFDQGEFIQNSLDGVRSTAVDGGIWAVVVLFLFLRRLRLTLLVALSIPFSVLVAIVWQRFSGGSFNVLTMTGITLALGMLVDNAIVVVENVVRLRSEGKAPLEACARGASQVGLAVLLSTLTSVVVFAPIMFGGGNPTLSTILAELGLPLCISLLASLLAALVFLPVQLQGALGDRHPLLQRAADALAPIASLPARGAARALDACSATTRALLFGLARPLRAACTPAARLRWLVAAGLLALGTLATLDALETARTAARLQPFATPGWSAADSLRAPAMAAALSLIAALLALFVLPRAARSLAREHAPPGAGFAGARNLPELIAAASTRALAWSLARPFSAAALLAMAIFSIAIPASRMEVASFAQDQSRARVNIYVQLEDNFTLAQAADEMRRYEDLLQAKKPDWGHARVSNRFSRTGGRLSLYWDAPQAEERFASVQRELKELLPKLAGHKVRFLDEATDANDRESVVFRLLGPDSETLQAVGARVARELEALPGVSEVRTPLSDAPPQVQVRVDSELANRLGVTPQGALQTISWSLRGFLLPRYQEEGRETPLLVEYDSEQAAGLATLRELKVQQRSAPVPLAAIGSFEFGSAPRSIARTDGRASFDIVARVADPALRNEVSAAGRALVEQLDLPRGHELARAELADERAAEELADLRAALLLSIVLVFLLMGILFESVLLPMSVLVTIPFAVLGAYWSLYLTGTRMDSVGWIGIIILVGVVVNNGIVLVDNIARLRAEGLERARAILEGTAMRVRPVLMTATTSVIGLVPLATTEPQGESIDYRALATAVAGGLVVSTFFTLVAVPLAYALVDDWARALRARFAWALRPARTTASATSPGG